MTNESKSNEFVSNSGAELCFDRGEPRLPQILFFLEFIYIYIQLYLYIFYIKFIL